MQEAENRWARELPHYFMNTEIGPHSLGSHCGAKERRDATGGFTEPGAASLDAQPFFSNTELSLLNAWYSPGVVEPKVEPKVTSAELGSAPGWVPRGTNRIFAIV